MTVGLDPRKWDSRGHLLTELSSAQESKCHMYKQEVVRHTENSGCLNLGVTIYRKLWVSELGGHHTSVSYFPLQVGIFQVVDW